MALVHGLVRWEAAKQVEVHVQVDYLLHKSLSLGLG